MRNKILLLLFLAFAGVQADAFAQRYDRDYREHRDQKDKKKKDRRYNDRYNRDRRYEDWTSSRNDEWDRKMYSCRPMNTDAFYDAKRTVENEAFDNTRLELATSIANMNCLTAEQIFIFTKVFSFESNRLAFAKNAYRVCADPQNYFRVMDAFTFSSSKSELSQFISGR